jgi:DNA repair photolyase
MTKTSVEYADENITVYPKRCPLLCRYCWASLPIWQHRIRHAHPIEEALRLARSKRKLTIVVSFTSDPYQPRELVEHKTRKTLEILSRTEHKVMLLTKSILAEEDFPFFSFWHNEGVDLWIGSTLTSVVPILDEPYGLSENPHRIAMLRTAHNLGLNTWASLEPWLPHISYPHQIVEATHDFVDWYVLGSLNYAKQFGYTIPEGYYQQELPRAIETLEKYGKAYLLKKELRKVVME